MAILYQNSLFYHTLINVVYGRHRHERFQAVAKWIPEGAEVLDVCCGDGSLAKYLHPSVKYRGLDQSDAFIAAGRKLGRQIDKFDLRNDPLPSSQIIVIQVSLYQFHPETPETVAKLYAAATERLIVSETVKSLTQARSSIVSTIVGWGTKAPGMETDRFRFSPAGLQELFKPYQNHLRDAKEVCGGRDWVYVVDKAPVQQMTAPEAA